MLCIPRRFSHVQLCNPWSVALQAPLSMGFFRQEYWTGLLCPSPVLLRIFLTQGLNQHLLCLLHWQTGTTSITWEDKRWTTNKQTKINENWHLPASLCPEWIPKDPYSLDIDSIIIQWISSCMHVALCFSRQSCPTLHNTVDCSLPGSSVHGILQARILE